MNVKQIPINTRSLARAEAAIQAAKNVSPWHFHDVTLHKSGYAEPSYKNPKSGIIATANWNIASDYQNGEWVVEDDTMQRLGDLLERLDIEIEWGDEWTSCSCGALVRTQPDSWGWTEAYVELDDVCYCADCVEVKNITISKLLQGMYKSNTQNHSIHTLPHWIESRLVENKKYVKLNKSYSLGWYAGSNDSPEKVKNLLSKHNVHHWFVIQPSQFQVEFDVWVKSTQAKKAQELLTKTQTKLPFNPATELQKVLTGQKSDHLEMHSKKLTSEEFIQGRLS